MIKKAVVTLVAVAGVFFFAFSTTGCAARLRAPLSETGEPIEMNILSNRGDPDTMTERQYRQRIEVGRWMERDLQSQIRRRGYVTGQIASIDNFEPAPGRYLLEVTIESYSAGLGGAGRAILGVSAASLETSYTLYGIDGEPLIEWTDGAGTSKRWTHAARRLNLNAVEKVTNYLHDQIPDG